MFETTKTVREYALEIPAATQSLKNLVLITAAGAAKSGGCLRRSGLPILEVLGFLRH